MPRYGNTVKVLVVEDNPGDYILIEDFLIEGFDSADIQQVSTYKDAHFQLSNYKGWNVVLLDLSLPDADGKDLVSKITAVSKEIPVIVLTGFSDKNFGIESLKLGVADYLLKDELSSSLLTRTIIYAIERKAINMELRNSEKKHRDIFQASPLPMWVYDLETYKFLDVNQAAVLNYGYSRDEFLSMTIVQIRPEEDIPKLFEMVNESKVRGTYKSGNFRHIKKNGEVIYVDIQSNSIDFEGRAGRLILAIDITDKILKEEQILKTNKRLKTASEIVKLGYWEFDIKTRNLFWTDGVYDICGMEQDDTQINDDIYHRLIHPEDLEVYFNDRKRTLEQNLPYESEHRLICPDGTIKYVAESGFIIYDENKIPIGVEGSIQDVTKQKQEKDHLKLLESVITHASETIIVMHERLENEEWPRIVFVNEAFSTMSGYTKDEVVGRDPGFMHGPKTAEESLDKIRLSLLNHETCELEMLCYKKNGDEFWKSFALTPVADSKGRFTHWISIEKDITERINYVNAIEKQNTLLREIAWTQSHVVRAPLARIMGLVNLLNDEESVSGNIKNLLNYIVTSAEELDVIIREIVGKSESVKL